MTEVKTDNHSLEDKLPEEQLRGEARKLYVDFLKSLLSIPDFKTRFVAQHRSGEDTHKPVNFELNGRSYYAEVRCKDWPRDILKIGEHEIGVPFPIRRLQIQIPILGYPQRSTIILFQFEMHSERVGSYPVLRDNQEAIQCAREFLGSLKDKVS